MWKCSGKRERDWITKCPGSSPGLGFSFFLIESFSNTGQTVSQKWQRPFTKRTIASPSLLLKLPILSYVPRASST